VSICTLFNRPYIDLEPYVDCAQMAALDGEICLALTRVATSYTGGSHKTMGIVPPSLARDPYVDYGQVIAAMTRAEFAEFVALGDEPHAFDLDDRAHYEFGEERDHPLNFRQMLYLKLRWGVYFPWKVYYELMPNDRWEDKARADGKRFTDEALRLLPRTIAFVRSLPFVELGRCNLLGLEANDHGTVHRDGDSSRAELEHFITFCPRGNKRLFLWDEETRRKTFIPARAYWFNDAGYHGVEADPFFRYSIRVDGVFDPAFLARLERDHPC